MLPYACPRLETHICKAQGKHSLGEFFPHSEAGLVGPPSRAEVPQVSQAWLSTLAAGQEAACQSGSYRSGLVLMVLSMFLFSDGHGVSSSYPPSLPF